MKCRIILSLSAEDIDPSVGKFRNMVQTPILPTKKRKLSNVTPTHSSPATLTSLTSLPPLHPTQQAPPSSSSHPISPSATQITSPTLGFSSLITKTITAGMSVCMYRAHRQYPLRVLALSLSLSTASSVCHHLNCIFCIVLLDFISIYYNFLFDTDVYFFTE